MRIAARLAGLAVLLAIAVVVPQVINSPLSMTMAVFTLLFAIMATGWNVLGGYTGYISLGHAAFFGIGAYALTLLGQHVQVSSGYEPFFLLPVVGLIGAASAVPLGIITLRTRRHVFVVLTIAMLFIGQLLATNLRDLTNGSTGLSAPAAPWMGSAFNPPFYYAALIVLVVAVAVSWWIRQSKFGLGLRALRDDEDRALGLGINAGLAKLVCFVVAAFFIAIAGGIYAYFQTYIYPQVVFDPLADLAMVLMAFTGGVGTVSGPVLGALLIEPAHEYFAFTYGGNGLYLILYGTLFLVVILLLPQGVIPTISYWLALYRQRRQTGAAGQIGGQVTPAAATQRERAGEQPIEQPPPGSRAANQ
ncbi:MAG TPA: branched-chain amino acid ABC transporter permease [Chloroflexota bacterium]|nr:branched-chain amino acid ABC transporter permease [Chloroflexota bacterium]